NRIWSGGRPPRGYSARLAVLLLLVVPLHGGSAMDDEAHPAPTAERAVDSAFVSTLTEIEVQAGQTSLIAGWDFTNHWDFPLMVERLESSCGCLAGQVGTQIVEPGKTGRITATFQPGAYRGILRKSIHVRFVNHAQPVELVLEAHIPSPVELSTSELSWIQGQSASAQTLEVKSGTATSFAITELLGISSELFAISKETVEHGKGYRIKITPAAGATVGTHILQVRTNCPDPRDQVLAVFLHIRSSDAPTQTAATP
ncbi:MAG TPA: DUF1573 domain-containing protein, partial [Luteolibacter sp.]|nr:DUF1573 domain-containing protein [Luteolibacter sp.]